MVRIECEQLGFGCPDFADVFVGCEFAQGLETPAVVVSADEVVEVSGQLGMAVVMIAFDGCLFDRAVHPLDLAVGPGMLHFGQAVFDSFLVTDPVEDVVEGVFVAGLIGELDTVVVSTVWMA